MNPREYLAAGRMRFAAWRGRVQPVVVAAAVRTKRHIARSVARAGVVARHVTARCRHECAHALRVALARTGAWHGAMRVRARAVYGRSVQLRLHSAARRLIAVHSAAGPARQLWHAARAKVAARLRSRMAATGAWLRTTALSPVMARLDRRSRPAPGRYRIQIATSRSHYVTLSCTLVVAALVALPAFASRTLINDLIFMFTMLALAQYWNLLAGYAGLVSVGQQAYVGLGGYVLFALAIHGGLDPLAAIVLAGLISAVVALPTALVVFRLRGAYFAIGTWVMAEVFRLVFAQFGQLGGGTGTSLPPFVTNGVAGIEWVKTWFDVRTSTARDIITYWAALALAAGTILLVYLVLRSRHGLALAAIRDSEAAAESVGVDNFRTKLKVYVMTAAGTGMVGALIYLQKARISPDAAFSVLDWTAYVIFIVVIGGIGTIEGPIVGVLVFYILQTNLAHFGTWYLILLGLFAILMMLFAPKGICGFLQERYGLVVFPVRRRLVANDPPRHPTSPAPDA
jgi:branched-chain amino acid transport system permease protein